jgi:hypothetical protein
LGVLYFITGKSERINEETVIDYSNEQRIFVNVNVIVSPNQNIVLEMSTCILHSVGLICQPRNNVSV